MKWSYILPCLLGEEISTFVFCPRSMPDDRVCLRNPFQMVSWFLHVLENGMERNGFFNSCRVTSWTMWAGLIIIFFANIILIISFKNWYIKEIPSHQCRSSASSIGPSHPGTSPSLTLYFTNFHTSSYFHTSFIIVFPWWVKLPGVSQSKMIKFPDRCCAE